MTSILLKIVLVFFALDFCFRSFLYAKMQYKRSKANRQAKETRNRMPQIAKGPVTHLHAMDLVSASQVFELNPERKYLLWWKQMLPQKEARIIQNSLQRLGLSHRIFMGPGLPEIYEFKDDLLKKVQVEKRPSNDIDSDIKIPLGSKPS